MSSQNGETALHIDFDKTGRYNEQTRLRQYEENAYEICDTESDGGVRRS